MVAQITDITLEENNIPFSNPILTNEELTETIIKFYFEKKFQDDFSGEFNLVLVKQQQNLEIKKNDAIIDAANRVMETRQRAELMNGQFVSIAISMSNLLLSEEILKQITTQSTSGISLGLIDLKTGIQTESDLALTSGSTQTTFEILGKNVATATASFEITKDFSIVPSMDQLGAIVSFNPDNPASVFAAASAIALMIPGGQVFGLILGGISMIFSASAPSIEEIMIDRIDSFVIYQKKVNQAILEGISTILQNIDAMYNDIMQQITNLADTIQIDKEKMFEMTNLTRERMLTIFASEYENVILPIYVKSFEESEKIWNDVKAQGLALLNSLILDYISRIAEIKAGIAVPELSLENSDTLSVAPLLYDNKGNLLDSSGNIISSKKMWSWLILAIILASGYFIVGKKKKKDKNAKK